MKNVIKNIVKEVKERKIFKILSIILIIIMAISLKISLKILINKRFIANYPDANQQIRLALMSFINLYEPYIAPYNYGNYYYNKEKYEQAYNKYLNALKYKIPKTRECSVRINTGLSLIKLGEKQKKRKDELLSEAREHLKKCIALKNDDEDDDDYEEMLEDQQKASNILEEVEEEIEKKNGNQPKNGGNGSLNGEGNSSNFDGSGQQSGNGGELGSSGSMFGIGLNDSSNGGNSSRGYANGKYISGTARSTDEKCLDCW